MAPVMMDASSEARNVTSAAISSGLATRPSGMRALYSSRSPGTVNRSRVSDVSTGPGQTALTRMPSRAWSMASVRV